MITLIIALGVAWRTYTKYRQAQFIRELNLVGFSTSMIGSPTAEREAAALQRAEELNIDFFGAYLENQENGARFDLAWLLITNESRHYHQYALTNVDSAPWPEVRIWVVRQKDPSLVDDYRSKLLELLLASPTSEAQLAAARWHQSQGNTNAAEDAFHVAMTTGLFWDSLDAADQLLESERYSEDAVNHLISALRDTKHFPRRAAISLLKLYNAQAELESLVDSCKSEAPDGPNRRLLVERLTQIVESKSSQLSSTTNAP